MAVRPPVQGLRIRIHPVDERVPHLLLERPPLPLQLVVLCNLRVRKSSLWITQRLTFSSCSRARSINLEVVTIWDWTRILWSISLDSSTRIQTWPTGTGDKGPNTHWVHGENIEITVNMWLKYAQRSNAEYILNIPCYVTQICPVGTCWVHFECAQPSDSNVPSGQTTGHIFNILKNLTPICPVGKVWPYFQ